MQIARAGLGLVFFIGVAWLLSENRRKIQGRVILGGLLLQIALALLILKTKLGAQGLDYVSVKVATFLSYGEKGAAMVFGPLALADGPAGFVFAFKALPVIIFFSAFMSLLYHLGVMQIIIRLMAKSMTVLLRVSGAESLAMAANVFVGQTEAPLVIRPYIPTMTRSELMALMCGGFATIAGSVLAVYMGLLGKDFAGHLLAASVMSAPAAFLMAKIMVPETEVPKTTGDAKIEGENRASNALEAIANGTGDGLKLYLNVLAMLIAFVALIDLINWPLGLVVVGDQPLQLERIFGWVLAPLAWVMGVANQDTEAFGSLLGIKVAVNEFVAFSRLSEMNADTAIMSARSLKMAAYALCGFANFASIGIQIGGIAPLAPGRRKDLSQLALRAMIGGACASWMTATIAGAFIPMDEPQPERPKVMTEEERIVDVARNLLAAKNAPEPRVGIILGSGLGPLADVVEDAVTISTSEIKGYPASTVKGHDGLLVAGRIAGVPVLLVKGRIHLYEGHDLKTAGLPARILCSYNPRCIVITNAAGGINPKLGSGQLMLIDDHINMMGQSPLEGANVESWGTRFPDMSEVYAKDLRVIVKTAATKLGIPLAEGVYAAMRGPQYETPAEVRLLGLLGADAVGMSTVPEAIVASHMGVPVVGISVVTNAAAGISKTPLNHEEVVEASKKAGEALQRLITEALPHLAAEQ